jgi:hypothetical protein
LNPEQIMTKAKSTNRPAAEAAQSKTDATTAKAKRQRGKAAPADTAPPAKTNLTETQIRDAIPAATPKPPRQTKAALLRVRLSEPGGVSLAALIEATGWQAHTLRAHLSGLRKEGLKLTRRREGEATIYAIESSGSRTSGAKEDSAPGAPPEAASGSTTDTPSVALPAVQGSGDGVDDADTTPVIAESNA